MREGGRGEVDGGDLPPGRGQPDRLGAVPAAGVEGAARLQVADLGEQVRVRWHLRDLVAVLVQGLRPAPLPGVAVEPVVAHRADATRASTSSTAAAATSQPSSADRAVRRRVPRRRVRRSASRQPLPQRGGQGGGVLAGDEQAGYGAARSGAERLPYPAHVGGEHGYAASQGLAGHDAVGLVARGQDEQVGVGVRRGEVGAGQGAGEGDPVVETGLPQRRPQAGGVLGVDRGADQRPGPAQVGQGRERLDEDVVPLDRRDGADREQPVSRRASPRPAGTSRRPAPRRADARPGRRRPRRASRGSSGSCRRPRRPRRSPWTRPRLARTGRRAGDGEPDRQVHQHHQAEPVARTGERVGRRRADQPVDDGGRAVGQAVEELAQAVHRGLVHGDVAAASPQRSGQPEVVDVPPARPSGVREADRPDEVDVQRLPAPLDSTLS